MQTKTKLELVRQHVSKANGLPNEHYVDPYIFEEEKNSILFNNWAGLDVCSEVPNIGDSKPINFLGLPLFIIRDNENVVRVFQNTCRHRGMILVEQFKNIRGAIRCPYHSWCYSKEGRLVSTPHVGGPGQNTDKNINKSELSLIEIRSYIWMDVIWININGNAEPFEKAMASTINRWKEFDQTLYHGGEEGKFSLNVKANWKLAVENYCESYHLPWVHPGLNSYSRLEDHYNITEYGSHSGQGSLVYRQLKDQKGKTFPDFKNLSKKWSTGAEYIALYPNVLLGVHRDHAFSIILQPLTCSETNENVHIYYSQSEVNPSLKKKNKDQWKEVFEEDIFVVEGMQTGRLGIKFDGGRFSPKMDEPTHCFHDWIAKKVDDFRNYNQQKKAYVTE